MNAKPLLATLRAAACLTLTLSIVTAPAFASRVLDVTPVTSSVLMLHLVDGTARHETLGNSYDGSVILEPLDTTKAAVPALYALSSADDASYKTPQPPQSVGRKSKGREFVKDGGKYEWVPEHWIFYPNGAKWPGYEMYIEDRYLAANNEFTVSDLATAVASFGYLRANVVAEARRAQ